MTQTLREATPTDVPDLLRLARDLAAYEKEPDAVEATEQMYATVLFPSDGSTPTAHTLVADVDGRVVGMAIWYLTFSTWTGVNGIWLEDLFVDPSQRGTGLGTALLRRLAQICVERDYRRLEWWVLTWNEPSIAFYRSLGSVPQDGWEVHRVDGEALSRLSAVTEGAPGDDTA
ncbi:MAG: GNAT family N-acetyltransferase [Nostocoides sp.]